MVLVSLPLPLVVVAVFCAGFEASSRVSSVTQKAPSTLGLALPCFGVLWLRLCCGCVGVLWVCWGSVVLGGFIPSMNQL